MFMLMPRHAVAIAPYAAMMLFLLACCCYWRVFFRRFADALHYCRFSLAITIAHTHGTIDI